MNAFNNHENDLNRRYSELARKWLRGTLTPEEEREYNDWYDNVSDDKEIKLDPDFAISRQQLKRRIFMKISRIAGLYRPVLSSHKRRKIYVAAASVLLLFGAISFYWYSSRKATLQYPKSLAENAYFKNDIAPGVNRAILTLSNGKKITLDDSTSGMLADEGGAQIVKSGKGGVMYEEGKGAVTVVNNTVSTPRGSQYRLTLPDGTKVWLNSASMLRYPTAFTGNERMVELEGQGYFEVAANARQPFKVKVQNMEVQVLGTDFDIMAYRDEATINTTLLTGSIQVKEGSHEQLLRPGQQAVINNEDHQLTVRTADIRKVTAWKNGLFVFNNMALPAILREMARWYDVDIVYTTSPGTELYGGGIGRNLQLADILALLEGNGYNHFKVEGRKVIVLP